MNKIKNKKLKSSNIHMHESSFICGCLPGYESAFTPTIKTKAQKTFTCPSCRKTYLVKDFVISRFPLFCKYDIDKINIIKICNNNSVSFSETDNKVIVTSFNHQIKNLNLDLYL